jgi:hypothetical protein
MCLSPQDKLKGSGLLAQRSKKDAKDSFVTKDAALLDVDMDSGWISDDNLRAMDFDDRLNQDIDWVVHDDDLDMSLAMGDFEPGNDDHDVVNDFGFGPTSYLSPLRGGLLTFEDSSEVSSSFECVNMELPERNATDAEKLLMSFDTMNFTIPSPTSSSSKKKRASLFAKRDQGKLAQARSSSAVSTGSMSPSLKLKVSARALTAEELQEEQAAAKAALSSSSADPFLGVLSITAPSSEQLLGDENAKKIGSYSPAARKLRIQKFHEKRKNRTWKKSIKYDCRKKLADDRPRIKGRFVRVLENMCDMKDDEPTSPASISSFTHPVTPISSPEPMTSPESSPMTPAVAAAMAAKIPVPAPTQTPAAAPVLSLVVPVQALSASTAAIASLVASTS